MTDQIKKDEFRFSWGNLNSFGSSGGCIGYYWYDKESGKWIAEIPTREGKEPFRFSSDSSIKSMIGALKEWLLPKNER